MTAMQLRLVGEPEGDTQPRDATQRLFDHWIFMLGKNPRRCALGPERKRVIGKALMLYDEETLRMAIEGCASSPFHNGDNETSTPYNDIELIMRNEKYIERFSAMGERLRLLADKTEAQERAQASVPERQVDEAQAQRHRQRLREIAAGMRAGR